MAGINVHIVEKAFKDFSISIENQLFKTLDKWCEQILRQAIRERMLICQSGEGYNITGNLINSICVLLYRKSNNTKTYYFADETGLKPAVRRELTALNRRGVRRSYRIRVKDWSGNQIRVNPDNLIPTDESFGINDAHKFASMWYPSFESDFVICVAYTSEYANFVEYARMTTGFLETENFVERTAVEWIGLN